MPAAESPPRGTDSQSVPPAPAKIFRPDDSRVPRDVSRLAELGIHRYAGVHFELFTDLEPDQAAGLPPLVDQLYSTWIDYFGELPPSRDGSTYQITGYLMVDTDRFAAAGLLPDDLPLYEHGRHRGREFWMKDQEFDYYRRHLLFHEATHCFMMTMPGPYPPLWYLEGMAEFFATHSLNDQGIVAFGMMPDASERYRGFGRIEMIHDEVAAGRLLSLSQIGSLGDREFTQSRTIPYAWSWALCRFLDGHPRYQERFRQLGRHLNGNEFVQLLAKSFDADRTLLTAEWEQFARRLEYGANISAEEFRLRETHDITISPAVLSVSANRGWQSTGITLLPDRTYAIEANGEVVLADEPRPWVSRPQGITVRYAAGMPIGTLLAGILPMGEGALEPGAPAFPVIVAGRSRRLTVDRPGLLFLRVNDFSSELDDNSGEYDVTIRQVDQGEE